MAARTAEAPTPAGFGNCGQCAYRVTGTSELCFGCARERPERLAPQRCHTCDQKLPPSGVCGNPLCKRTPEERGWNFIWAISMRSGPLKQAISLYKYENKTGWAWIFGRILVGYLESMPDTFRQFGLIIPMPTYVGPGGRDWDHIGTIIERAAIEGPSWPLREGVIVKTAPTQQLTGLSFAQRAATVERELAPALHVADAAALKDQHILVFDDVFTGGLTLREVAFKLISAGARSVAGIVLARQPYRG